MEPKDHILTQETAKKLLRKSANGKVTLPSNITKLERGCFANTDVQEVILPEGITTIEKNAFAGCINLKKITFPSSLSNIGDSAFQNCTSLAELDLSKTNLKGNQLKLQNNKIKTKFLINFLCYEYL